MEELPPPVAKLADKLDNLVRLTEVGPLTVPALAALIGRYVAYEAGNAEQLKNGLQICWEMMRVAAIEEAVKLYGQALGKFETANPKGEPELTPREAKILAEVLAAHPTLTRDEALRHLREAGL